MINQSISKVILAKVLQKLAIASVSLDRPDLVDVLTHHLDVVHCRELLLFPLLWRLIDYIRWDVLVWTLLALVLRWESNRLEIGNG